MVEAKERWRTVFTICISLCYQGTSRSWMFRHWLAFKISPFYIFFSRLHRLDSRYIQTVNQLSRAGLSRHMVVPPRHALFLQLALWLPENSGIGSRLSDSIYDFKYSNEHEAQILCSVKRPILWFINCLVKLFAL